MSLETELKQLNATLERGCDLLEKLAWMGAPTTAPGETEEKKPAPEKKASTKKKAAPKKKKEEPVVEETNDDFDDDLTGESDAPVLDYEKDVKPVILANAKEHRPEIEGIFQRYGAKKGTDIPEDKYQEFIDRLNNAVENGLESDSAFMEDY